MFFERFTGFNHHPRCISDPKRMLENVEFRQYDSDNLLMEPMAPTHNLASFINDWAKRGLIHRKVLWGALTRTMFEFRGITTV